MHLQHKERNKNVFYFYTEANCVFLDVNFLNCYVSTYIRPKRHLVEGVFAYFPVKSIH